MTKEEKKDNLELQLLNKRASLKQIEIEKKRLQRKIDEYSKSEKDLQNKIKENKEELDKLA